MALARNRSQDNAGQQHDPARLAPFHMQISRYHFGDATFCIGWILNPHLCPNPRQISQPQRVLLFDFIDRRVPLDGPLGGGDFAIDREWARHGRR